MITTMENEGTCTRRSLILALAGLASSSGCLQFTEADPTQETITGQSSSTGTDMSTVTSDDRELQTDIEEIWRVDHKTSAYRTQLLLEQSLILCAPEGAISRVQCENGAEMWRQEFSFTQEDWESIRSYPTLAKDQVLLGGRSHVYSLDVDTGEINWQTEIPGQSPLRNTTTELEVAEGTVVCAYNYSLENGDDFGGVLGIDSRSGQIEWNQTHDDIAAAYEGWLSTQALSPPINGEIIVSGWNESFWIDSQTGEILRRSDAEARFDFESGNQAVYSTDVGVLFEWDISDSGLTERWSFEPLGRPSTSPAVGDGLVYFGADDTGIYAVTDGEQRWRFQADSEVSTKPGIGSDGIWATGESLYWIEKETGRGVSATINLFPYGIVAKGNRCVVTGANHTVGYRANDI